MGGGFVLIALLSTPLGADVSFEDLVPNDQVVLSEAERESIRKQIAADRAREAQRQQEARLAQQERERQWQANQAQRPLAELRVEQRCLTCHTPQLLAEQPRTLLHWGLVVQRMKWLNGADIPMAETYSLAQQLAQANPARSSRRWMDVLVLISVFMVVSFVGWQGYKKIAKQNKKNKGRI